MNESNQHKYLPQIRQKPVIYQESVSLVPRTSTFIEKVRYIDTHIYTLNARACSVCGVKKKKVF